MKVACSPDAPLADNFTQGSITLAAYLSVYHHHHHIIISGVYRGWRSCLHDFFHFWWFCVHCDAERRPMLHRWAPSSTVRWCHSAGGRLMAARRARGTGRHACNVAKHTQSSCRETSHRCNPPADVSLAPSGAVNAWAKIDKGVYNLNLLAHNMNLGRGVMWIFLHSGSQGKAPEF